MSLESFAHAVESFAQCSVYERGTEGMRDGGGGGKGSEGRISLFGRLGIIWSTLDMLKKVCLLK